MTNKKTIAAWVAMAVLSSTNTNAAVTPEEAAKLTGELTPIGAERQGNTEGTIPEWKGGLTKVLPGWPNKNNDRPNPYADDTVKFVITADNYKEHADKLTPGTVALFESYPESFSINVYPTRRTAAFPESFYDATTANATSASLTEGGIGVQGAKGGVPFPIPKNGQEVIWNYLLGNPNSVIRTVTAQEGVIYNNGQRQDWTFDMTVYTPYQDMASKAGDKDVLLKMALMYTQPARDAGEGVVVIDYANPSANPRKAWSYDPGERRVRRAPSLKFDTPDRPLNVIDDVEVYSGSPERYDWKLIGKKEMYVPYNNNLLNSPNNKVSEVTTAPYIKSDLIRYELHRVWVVEGTLKDGQRHLYKKRVKYIDEDSWRILANERYDGAGELWRIGYGYPVVATEIPLTSAGVYTNIDLKKGGYHVFGLPAEGVGYNFSAEIPKDSYFTAAALRRRGR